jgi:uncharacterized membrane protein YgcG
MNGVMLGIIIFLAVAGPTLLALALYWWRNPDRRLSWRRALEESNDADRDHFRQPSWRSGGWFMGGGDSSGGGGGDSGGGSS